DIIVHYVEPIGHISKPSFSSRTGFSRSGLRFRRCAALEHLDRRRRRLLLKKPGFEEKAEFRANQCDPQFAGAVARNRDTPASLATLSSYQADNRGARGSSNDDWKPGHCPPAPQQPLERWHDRWTDRRAVT